MSVNQKEHFNIIFNEYDLSGNGTLDKKEFQLAMKHTNQNLTDEQIEKLFNQIDLNRNGVIEYEEFMQGLLDLKSLSQKETIEHLVNLIGVDQRMEHVHKKDFIKKFKYYTNSSSQSTDEIVLYIFDNKDAITISSFKAKFLKYIEMKIGNPGEYVPKKIDKKNTLNKNV